MQDKSFKGTAHESAITRTDRLLRDRLGEQVLLRLQSPVQLDDYSEPEPDIAVVMPNPLDYDDHHPSPSEVVNPLAIAPLKQQSRIKTCL